MKRIFTLLLLCIAGSFLFAQEIPFSQAEYDQRREAFIDVALANINTNSFVCQAYKGQPVGQSTFDYLLERLRTSGEFDFNLVQIVRMFYFTNGEYESKLLPAIDTIPLWLTPDEKLRVYWSENHIIMWLSSAYLLRQKYGWTNVPEDLDKMLNQWLDLKIQYGFYEFYSSVYFPFTLSGVLNLVDFAEDPVIRNKATLVANRMLKELLLCVNDQGVFYPAAGRNSADKYRNPYGQSVNHIIYMLTGLGEPATSASHGGGFLATTSLDVKSIVESWRSKENLILDIGHTLQEGFALNSHLQDNDRVIFQWSSGAYFHPDVALQTFNLIDGYRLWDHKEFNSFSLFKDLPGGGLITFAAEVAASISKSSLISGQKVGIFKDKSVTLCSIQDYWKGRLGYQQWPWAATAGKLPVYTQAGELGGFLAGEDLNRNSTLPYIAQKDNVALIMYRANKDLALFGYDKHDITLYFKENNYDEVAFEDQWILGREGDGYVAVLRHCYDKVDSIYTCDDQDGQVWGVIVGNSDMYGSFENFRTIVANARHEEKWIFKLNTLEWVYYGMIDIDGKMIEHYWNGNLLSFPKNPVTGIDYLSSNEGGFSIYPNPAGSQFAVQFNQPVKRGGSIRIMDMTGREVYFNRIDNLQSPVILLDCRQWGSGLYAVLVETSEGVMSRKLMVNN